MIHITYWTQKLPRIGVFGEAREIQIRIHNTTNYLQSISLLSFIPYQIIHSSIMGNLKKFLSDKMHLHMPASSARSTDRTRLREHESPNSNHSFNNPPYEQKMSTPIPIHEPPKSKPSENSTSSPTRPRHQVTRSISEVGTKLHSKHHGHHHHPHLHRKDKEKGEGVPQSAGPNLQPEVSRSEPNESRDVSRRTSVFEVPIPHEGEKRREVGEERERGLVRATFVPSHPHIQSQMYILILVVIENYATP